MLSMMHTLAISLMRSLTAVFFSFLRDEHAAGSTLFTNYSSCQLRFRHFPSHQHLLHIDCSFVAEDGTLHTQYGLIKPRR